MSKQQWLDMHERLVGEYQDANPDADWTEAYLATADSVQDRLIDEMAGKADEARDRAILQLLEAAERAK